MLTLLYIFQIGIFAQTYNYPCISDKICNNIYSPEVKDSFGRIMDILYGAKNGVHAFCYNSSESKPIWMKSGAL